MPDNSEKTRQEIDQAIEDMVYFIEATESLGMNQFAQICMVSLAFLRELYKTKFQELATVPHKLVPSIMADTMQDLCEETVKSLEKISRLAREGEFARGNGGRDSPQAYVKASD